MVLEAATFEQAIAACHSDERIDVLITDIQLNCSANGWDVADRFRAARPGIPVVYTSGNPLEQSRRVPDSVFLPKPYYEHEVLNACHAALGKLPQESNVH